MRIERLALNGVLRFGVPIELDFRALPPGLIAVVGENGAGKTSILEAMIAAFYRQLPSRGDVLDYATGRDSYIDVLAAFDDRGTYRARVSLDGVARKSDAVLELEAHGVRQVLNDGKVTTFDQVIARELPPLAQLLASSFSAQNRRGSFSTLDKKGRRDLFASLLGLAELERHAGTSRQAALTIDRRLGELKAVLERLIAETTEAQRATLTDEGTALEGRATGLQDALATATRAIASLEGRRTVVLTAAAAYTKAQDARTAADRRIAQATDKLRAIEAAEAAKSRATERALSDIETTLTRVIDREGFAVGSLPTPDQIADTMRTTIQRIDADLAEQRGLRETRIQNNQQLVETAADIRGAARLVRVHHADLEVLAAELETRVAAELLARTNLQSLTLEHARLAGVEAERRGVVATTAVLDRVPFGEKCGEAGCEFVRAAVQAKTRLPEIERQRARQAELAAQIADLTTELARRVTLTSDARSTRDAVQAQVTPALLAQAALLPTLEAALTRIAELQAEIVGLDALAAGNREAAARAAVDAAAARDRAIDGSADRVRQAQQTADADTARLTEDARLAVAGFDALRTPIEGELLEAGRARTAAEAEIVTHAPAHDALAAVDLELTAVRQRHATETAAAARLEAEREAFARRRREFDDRLLERQRLTATQAALEQDLVEWQALAKIFGPEGLPVLEIDAAGPGVSALANDLLQACFGGRFTVELVTQEPKADGKGYKEVFELKVFDGERGGEARDLTDLSGGEQVLVDEALKSAIALFVNQRNALPIRTCWRDETTGALDPENALRYVAMLRRVRERGGIHHLFFVSHNPDAAALADAQLVVAGGRVEIVQPPFRQVA